MISARPVIFHTISTLNCKFYAKLSKLHKFFWLKLCSCWMLTSWPSFQGQKFSCYLFAIKERRRKQMFPPDLRRLGRPSARSCSCYTYILTHCLLVLKYFWFRILLIDLVKCLIFLTNFRLIFYSDFANLSYSSTSVSYCVCKCLSECVCCRFA